MKFSIPIEMKQEGGFYSFLRNFINYLDKKGYHYSREIEDDEDVLFTNSWITPYGTIKKAKKRNLKLKVLHRIDGSAKDYGRRGNADKIQSKVNTLADVTIFQSNYGKYATSEKYHLIRGDGPVIYNPVDINTFTPEGANVKFPYKYKICCATFSTNKKKGLETIYAIAEEHCEFDFILCGRFSDAPPLDNIHLMGLLNRYELAKIMRSCDLFLFPSENETCPNVVLEAMASGLPVLYHNSGGTSEIVGDCGMPLSNNFKTDVGHLNTKRSMFTEITRKRVLERHSPDKIFKQYIDAVVRAERKPLKRSLFFHY